MNSSIVLARILGPYCLIIALAVLINLKTYKKLFEDLTKNNALIYLSGAFALIFGLVIIQFHNIWTADWRVIITVVGWLGLIKGIWLVIFPDSLGKTVDFHLKNPSLLVARLFMLFLMGLVLTVNGFLISNKTLYF